MQYKFKQKVNKEDYLAFYKYHVTKNFMSPIKLVFIALFFVILFSGFFFGNQTIGFAGIVLFIFVGLLFLRISKSGSKIYDADPEAFSYDYVMDSVTISFSTKDGRSSKMWSEFTTFFENDLYLYIFTKTNKGLMFVKTALEPEVYNFIKGKLDENSKSVIKYLKKDKK